MTVVELWNAWCDIDEHTEVHLAFDGEDEFDTFKLVSASVYGATAVEKEEV